MRHLTLLLCFASAVATAQEPASSPAGSASAAAGRVKVRPISLRPSDVSYYPAELSSVGVQGTTIVQAELNAAGVPVGVVVSEGSRSTELDTAALAVVRSLTFKAREPTAQPLQVLVPVEFLRDSVETLRQKTCGEFNVDAQYFKAKFPEAELREMKVISMTIGVLFMARPANAGDQAAYAKSLSAAVPRLLEMCTSQPEVNFLEAFTRAVRSGGG